MENLILYIKKYWLAIIFFVILIILFICNVGDEDFFDVSFINILTLFIGFFISFYLTQHFTDKRRKVDCIEHIIIEIQHSIMQKEMYTINPNALFYQSSCANKIKYLEEASFPELKNDLKFISDKFNEIRDLYSNHNGSEESLLQVQSDFERHKVQINDKCDKIRLIIYKL